MVLTQDLDFVALLAATSDSGPSVVQIRAGDMLPASTRQHVISALEHLPKGLNNSQLITVHVAR